MRNRISYLALFSLLLWIGSSCGSKKQTTQTPLLPDGVLQVKDANEKTTLVGDEEWLKSVPEKITVVHPSLTPAHSGHGYTLEFSIQKETTPSPSPEIKTGWIVEVRELPTPTPQQLPTSDPLEEDTEKVYRTRFFNGQTSFTSGELLQGKIYEVKILLGSAIYHPTPALGPGNAIITRHNIASSFGLMLKKVITVDLTKLK